MRSNITTYFAQLLLMSALWALTLEPSFAQESAEESTRAAQTQERDQDVQPEESSDGAETDEARSDETRSYKPHIVYQPPVIYPAPAVGGRVVGEVVLKFLVDAEGKTEDISVESAQPIGYGFERAALDMGRNIRFVAPQVSGIEVRSALSLTVRFTPSMLVKELRRRGLFEEAEDFLNRARYADQSELSQDESNLYGAHESSTDVKGLSIHSIVQAPEREVERALEEEMPEVEGPTGELEGLVFEQGSQRPIANATVKLSGFEVKRVTTAWGRFRFAGVPVGRVTVLVNHSGYHDQSREVVIEPGDASEVYKVYLSPISFQERERRGSELPPRSATRHHLQRDEIQNLAGVDSDFLKAARDLPGLYRAGFDLDGAPGLNAGGGAQWGGSSELVFRGGVEGGAYLLGAPVLLVSHLNQSRTILPTAMLSEVQVDPDYAFEYGRAGGGLMQLKLASPTEGRHRAEVELNAFEVSGLFEGRRSSRTSVTGAIKVGTMRGFQSLLGADAWLSDGVQVPQSQDAHLYISHRDGRHDFKILSTWHHSSWSRDYEFPGLYQNERRGDIGQSQSGVNARMLWTYASPIRKLKNELSVSLDLFSYQQQADQRSALQQNLSQIYIADRLKLRLTKPLWLSVGLEQQVSYSYLSSQGSSLWSEGMGRAARRVEPSPEVGDDIFTYSPSAWAGIEGRWAHTHVLLGSRVTYWSETQQVTPEPRLTVRYTPAFGTILKLGGGLYTAQLRPRYFDRYLGAGVARGVKLRQPQHIFSSAGWEQRFTDQLYMDVTGFYRYLSDRLIPNQDPTIRFESGGEGAATGAEVFLRYEPDARYYGWISYGFTHARFTDRPGDNERRGDFDQTHNLSALAGVKITPALRLNTRWRYVSGTPYSPLPTSTFDSDQGQQNFAWGPVNSLRYDDFHQLDLRLDYRWTFTDWSLLTYLQVNNVYHRLTDEAPHPLSGVNPAAPSTLTSWPTWVSVGARAQF